MTSSKNFDLILYGATGFTGKLVAQYLIESYGISSDLKWAIAGRNKQKLEEIRQSLGADTLPVLIADSHDLQSLEELAAQSNVICSTVGPYALHGSLLVEACVKQATHYCDLTGEVPWIRRMIDKHHRQAQDKKVKIVHCCGFDSIPSDLGVYFLQKHSLQLHGSYCQQIKFRVRAAKGGISGGTYASLSNVLEEAQNDPGIKELLADPYALNPRDQPVVGSDEIDPLNIAFDKDFNSWISPFIMASINTRIVRRSHALAGYPYGDDFTYQEAVLTGNGFYGKLKAKMMAAVINKLSAGSGGILKKAADFFLPDPGEGPSREQRQKGFFKIKMLGITASGTQIHTQVTGDGDPGYGSTSKMLGESAACLALDSQQLPATYGVLTPAIAMEDMLLERLRSKAGLTFELLD